MLDLMMLMIKKTKKTDLQNKVMEKFKIEGLNNKSQKE